MKKALGACAVIIAIAGLGIASMDSNVSAANKAESPVDIVNAYTSAWNERDEGARRTLLERAWADDGVYTDPSAEVKGRDALIKHTGEFANNPEMKGFSLKRTSGVDVHHNVLRFDWALVDAAGKTVIAGIDFGVLADDGRLQRITGFFGPIPDME